MVRSPCCNREHTRRGTWSKEEDMLLIKHMNTHGVVDISWRSLPKMAGLNRCGKSCRLRWVNYLKPDVKRGNFDSTENDMIIKLHAEFGNKWSLIAGKLNGRTDNEIKNHWNTNLKRMLLDKGIDPKTHKPLHGSPDQSTVTSTAPPTADANKTGTGSSIDSFINTNTLPTTDFATSGMHVVINNTIDAPTNAEPDLFVLTTNKNNNNNDDDNNNIVPNLINLPLGLPSHKPKSCPMNPLAWLKLGQKSG